MDNIFTALVRRRTTGVVMEFVLWCIVWLCGTVIFDRTGDGGRQFCLDSAAFNGGRSWRDHGISFEGSGSALQCVRI